MLITARIIREHPTIMVQLGSILLLPWAWAAFVMPWWASAVCAALWAPALLLGVRFLVAPMYSRRRAGEESLTSEELIKIRAPNAAALVADPRVRGELGSLHQGLRRWRESSSVSSGETTTARERVTEVISQTETAVLALTLSFRGITGKTRQQMEAAMSLLKRNVEQANIAPGSWLSLPDYIHAYELQLQEVIDSMIGFSAVSDDLLHHQKKVREQSVVIDDLLDELRSMALCIGRLALDSSLAADGSGKNREYLIKLSDSIRQTSDQTHGLTRTVRRSLETIKDQLVVVYKVINNAALLAKESARRAKADVAQLNVTMIEKTKEVEESLSKINGLGEAIQQDVNNAIIAMQFQDITQQKLEHMRGNLLGDVVDSLDTLSEETEEMLKKSIFRAIQADGEHRNPSGDRPPASPGVAGPVSGDLTKKIRESVSVSKVPDAPPIAKVELF